MGLQHVCHTQVIKNHFWFNIQIVWLVNKDIANSKVVLIPCEVSGPSPPPVIFSTNEDRENSREYLVERLKCFKIK